MPRRNSAEPLITRGISAAVLAARTANSQLQESQKTMRNILRAALVLGTLSTPMVVFAGDPPAKADTKADAKTDAKTPDKAPAKTDAKADTKTDTKAGAKTDTTKAKTTTSKTKTTTTKSGAKTETKTDASKTETKTDAPKAAGSAAK
jgi:hypothetical protein